MRILSQILVVLGLAVSSALFQGIIEGPPGEAVAEDETAISLDAALGLENLLWVDARSQEAYETGHLPGAIFLNEDNWEEGLETLIQMWDPAQPVVVYCDGGGCSSSRKVADRLRNEVGINPAYWLIDGWVAIENAGVNL